MNELKERVRQDYNKDSAWRVRQDSNNYWLEVERIKVSGMLPQKVKRALDLGCGRGYYLKVLSEVSDEVVALDFSEVLLKDAQRGNKNNPGVTGYILGDAESLPYASNSFDLVLAIQIIAHIPNPDLLLKEINRVLKDGGILILSTGNSLSLTHYVKTLLQMAAHVKRKGAASFISNFFKFFSHDRTFWIGEQGHARDSYFYLKDKLQKNGFNVQSVRGAGFTRAGIPLTEEIIKKMGSFIKKIDYRLSDFFPTKFCSSLIILKSYISSEYMPRRD